MIPYHIWALALRLLPRTFRERHAEEMTDVLEAHLQGRGRLGRLRAWISALADVVRIAVQQRGAGWSAALRTSREGAGMMGGGWRQDLAFAARALRRRPLFAAMAVVTLGLGLGVTTAVGTVVYTVVLAPTPYPDPDRVVQVARATRGRSVAMMPAIDVRTVREGTEGLLTVGVSRFRDVSLTGLETPERVRGVTVTGATLGMLGIPPALGRLPASRDDVPGGSCLTALSHDLWTEHLGAGPDVVGSVVRLDGQPCTVVAVMPPGFAFPAPYFAPGELWLLAGPEGVDWTAETGPGFLTFGRLAPGAGLEAVRAALGRLPSVDEGARFTAMRWAGASREASGRRLLVLLAAAALVLAIACANVVALQLGRYVDREDEIATRISLGASRGRLVRLVVAESGLLVAAGAMMGLLVALWSVDLIVALRSYSIPRMEEVTVDRLSVLVCVGLAVLVGIVAAAVPALALAGRGTPGPRRATRRSSTPGRRGRRFGRLLVGVETALALVLLAGAGLLFQSYRALEGLDPGFRTASMLHARATPADARDPDGAARHDFYARMLARVAALPGIRDVALTDVPPGVGAGPDRALVVTGREPASGDPPRTAWRTVSASYFRTLDIPLLQGGGLDGDGTPRAVVVNQAFVRRFFPEGEAMGRRLERVDAASEAGRDVEAWTIVGIAADAHEEYAFTPPPPVVYARLADDPPASVAILAHTVGAPLEAVRPVQRAVATVDAEQPLYGLRDFETILASEYDLNRLGLALLAIFASAALLLAVAGIYGVVAQVVGRRRREMGIRIALGALAADVLRLVVGDCARFAAAGALAGLALLLVAGDRLGALSPAWVGLDAAVLTVTAVTVTGVAVAAAWIPARRASSVDPVTVLREE